MLTCRSMIKNRRNLLFPIVLIIFSLVALLILLMGCAKIETKAPIEKAKSSSENTITSVESPTAASAITVGPKISPAGTAIETSNEVIFSFAVSGDNRPGNDNSPQPKVFINILNSMKKFNPSFYINTGDIINGGTSNSEIIKRQFSDFIKAVSILNCPVYVTAGNHEIQNSKGRSSFNELFSYNGKSYHYFKYQNIYFIVLDAYEEGNWGSIKGEELSWLENLLPTLKTEKVFVFLHPPVYSVMNPNCITDGSMHIAFSDKKNQNDIRKLFSDNNVDGVFSGHEHMFHKQREGNTEYIITGCSGASPYVSKDKGGFYHFLIIDVKQNSWVFKVNDESGKLLDQEEIAFN